MAKQDLFAKVVTTRKYDRNIPRYNVIVSLSRRDHGTDDIPTVYATASVVVTTDEITTTVEHLTNVYNQHESNGRTRKGTKAERELAAKTALAAVAERQAERVAEEAAKAEEPAAEQEAPETKYAVPYAVSVNGSPQSRFHITVYATSPEEALRKAKATAERAANKNGKRTEWWNNGGTLAAFDDDDSLVYIIDYATEYELREIEAGAAEPAGPEEAPAPKDDRPDFLVDLSCGQVTQADDGENGLGAFVIGLYNENGSRLGTGFADIVGENGPAWELVCDDYLVDMSDEGWCSNDHGIAAVIAKAVADYTAPTGKRPNIRQYVAAKEAEAFHTDTPWFPRTEAERAAADGLSLEAWREAVEIESAEIERGGPGMDQLSAADQSPELRAFTHSQWELAAWGYNGDGTPHRKSAEERAQIIAQVIAGTESGPRTMSRGELVDLLAQAYTAGFEARKEQAK